MKIEDVTDGSENIKILLKRAQKNRAVAATNCNERSSRSHSVFVLKITGKNSITSESCTGTLNLVDLAGSERLKDSGSTGQRLEETKSINSSLSNLSKVIMALANNKVDTILPFFLYGSLYFCRTSITQEKKCCYGKNNQTVFLG